MRSAVNRKDAGSNPAWAATLVVRRMRKTAEQIVDAMLEGRVKDWLSDKWQSVKVATGIGHDEFGMGKPEKGFKPKYGPVSATYTQKKTPVRRSPDTDQKTWSITP